MTAVIFTLDLWILSHGRNHGASRYIGQLFNTGKPEGKPVLLALTHWGSIKRRELLMGISVYIYIHISFKELYTNNFFSQTLFLSI